MAWKISIWDSEWCVVVCVVVCVMMCCGVCFDLPSHTMLTITYTLSPTIAYNAYKHTHTLAYIQSHDYMTYIQSHTCIHWRCSVLKKSVQLSEQTSDHALMSKSYFAMAQCVMMCDVGIDDSLHDAYIHCRMHTYTMGCMHSLYETYLHHRWRFSIWCIPTSQMKILYMMHTYTIRTVQISKKKKVIGNTCRM